MVGRMYSMATGTRCAVKEYSNSSLRRTSACTLEPGGPAASGMTAGMARIMHGLRRRYDRSLRQTGGRGAPHHAPLGADGAKHGGSKAWRPRGGEQHDGLMRTRPRMLLHALHLGWVVVMCKLEPQSCWLLGGGVLARRTPHSCWLLAAAPATLAGANAWHSEAAQPRWTLGLGRVSPCGAQRGSVTRPMPLGEGGMRAGQARVLVDGGMHVGHARAWRVDRDLGVQQARGGAGMVGGPSLGLYHEAKRCAAVVGT